MSLDALHGTDVAFDERIHMARPHAGQVEVAANLRRLLAGSQIRESHKDCGRVQDAYSLRCIPQVHGAVRDTLAFCRTTFEIEMNSAVDNPLVFTRKGHGDGRRHLRAAISTASRWRSRWIIWRSRLARWREFLSGALSGW